MSLEPPANFNIERDIPATLAGCSGELDSMRRSSSPKKVPGDSENRRWRECYAYPVANLDGDGPDADGLGAS